MRYLNIQTLRQTTKFIDEATTIPSTDARVSNWFTPCPDGFKGEWIDGTYTFVEIPLPTQAELDALEAERIQQEKIQAVEATDKDMIRIAEDLVDALVSKGVIAITDLPLSAQEKFTNRKAKRSAI